MPTVRMVSTQHCLNLVVLACEINLADVAESHCAFFGRLVPNMT